MEDTSALILRHSHEIPPGTLLINPPDDSLLAQLPPGRFVSLHYGRWQRLSQNVGWTGEFGLDSSEPCELAVIWMPKARREFDLLVAWALSQIGAGGRLWLVGPKKGGTDSSGKALRDRLGRGAKKDSARHCQLWAYPVGNESAPFVLDEWASQRSTEIPVGTHIQELVLADFPGVFSQGRLDDGTELLLRSLTDAPDGPLLDFACGGGVIGAVLQSRWPMLKVTYLDVQWQALQSTRHTLEANGLEGEVVAGDGLGELTGRYGTIITNPPFHSGLKTDLEVVQQFIAKVKTHLLPGGVLWMVANAFLPYLELLEKQFPQVEIVADNRRFRVYRSCLSRGK